MKYTTISDACSKLKVLVEDNLLTEEQQALVIATVNVIAADSDARYAFLRMQNEVLRLQRSTKDFLSSHPLTLVPK